MNASWDWPGSRWWRFDLHAHSPKSYDFGSQVDRDNPDWTRWITAARDAGIQAIAVTDHNTADAIDHLQNAVSEVEGSPDLFPGVELTAGDGIHLLLLMDPHCTRQHIDDRLSTVGVPVDQRGRQGARSPDNVERILDAFGDEVLIIGAHVNRRDGLLELTGQQRIAVLRHPRLAAVEVNPSEPLDESWIDGSRPEIRRRISQVQFSDSHDYHKSRQRFTWVKMTRPNLEGLRLALLDGAASLRPTTQDDPGHPNAHADLAIEKITIHKAKFVGQPCQFTVEFNPWLNTIIGGRGTGKSTLVDFCRKTLRRESELDGRDSDEDGSLRNLFDRRMRVPADRQSEGLLTPQTCINIVYRRDGDRFELSWSQDGKATPIARLDGDQRSPQEGDIRERFPVRIYSQKQLFALAQDPNALLAVIDDSRAVRKVEIDRAMGQLEARYLSLCAEARAASRLADDLPNRHAALEDLLRKLGILQQGGHAQVLNEYRIRRQQDDTWQEILRRASQVVEATGDSAEKLLVADLNLASDIDGDLPTTNLRRAHALLLQTVEDLRQGVRELVDKSREDIESIRTGPEASRWREAVEDGEAQYREASAQLAAEGISNPNEYGDLLEQAARLSRDIEALESERDRAARIEREAVDVLAKYRCKREELSNKRKDFVGESASEIIQVRVAELADYQHFESELCDALGTEHFKSDRQAIVQMIQPERGKSWGWGKLDWVVTQMRRFLSGELDSWTAQDHRFNTALKRVLPERIDRLALFVPEDSVTVRFHDDRGGDWTSLARGSPGQQTAALLAFVLGYGTEPIILDQPEDDLDNTLIYKLLVQRLREAKRTRQVIVVTHNPNIVVHGDAELVLSLEAAAGQSVVTCQGGLQERNVRDEICRVMEGGREAFERRYHRIMSATEPG